MNRRSFLKRIAGAVAAAVALPIAAVSVLETNPVVVENRKLKARWTMEAAQDLRAMHNLAAEGELRKIMSDQVIKEIDAEIMRSLI